MTDLLKKSSPPSRFLLPVRHRFSFANPIKPFLQDRCIAISFFICHVQFSSLYLLYLLKIRLTLNGVKILTRACLQYTSILNCINDQSVMNFSVMNERHKRIDPEID